MSIFLAETHTEGLTTVFRGTDLVAAGKTEFQRYQIMDVPVLGRVVFLDGKSQSAALDEFIYHECLVQPAMITQSNPRRVLVCGGGEGATLREVLKHDTVEHAVMVDIDKAFVDVAREHLGPWHQGAFDDPRVELVHTDARAWIRDREGPAFDVIIIDLNDPVPGGPAVALFTLEFYAMLVAQLAPDGVLALQAGSASPTHLDFFVSTWCTIGELLPVRRAVCQHIAPYMEPWAFLVASRAVDPVDVTDVAERLAARNVVNQHITASWYHPALALPTYVEDALDTGRIITDANPMVWED